MTTIDGNVRLTRSILDLDDNGHHASTVMYAESNTPPAGTNQFDFDTFYDVDQVDLSLVIPPTMGLSYLAGSFVADEDGVWAVNVSVELAAAPGENGYISITAPTYGVTPLTLVASAQAASTWTAHLVIPMRIAQTFQLFQSMPTVPGATYATLDIIRIARSVL